jgi:hypothetical protein
MAKQAPQQPKKPAPPVAKSPAPKMTKEQLNQMYADAAERADAGNITRITLEKGENTIRIVDPVFTENFVAYIEDTEGNTKRVSMGLNPTQNKEKYAILFEKLPDASQSHRYYFKAIQGKKVKTATGVKVVMDTEVKLFEIGPSIFKQLAAIQSDSDFPSIDEINIKITKTGEKLKTEYNVMPSPKATPLPKDLVGDVDLDALVEETSLEAVYEYLGEEYDGTPSEDAEDSESVDDITEESAVDEVTEEVEAETGDGFDDMDRKELLVYNKQYSLGITVYKNWTDDQIRDAIRAKIAEMTAETETEETVEEDVEETTEETVEVETDEDDLSDLDDLEDEAEPVKPAPVKKPAPLAKKK